MSAAHRSARQRRCDRTSAQRLRSARRRMRACPRVSSGTRYPEYPLVPLPLDMHVFSHARAMCLRRLRADRLQHFYSGRYDDAIALYSKALAVLPAPSALRRRPPWYERAHARERQRQRALCRRWTIRDRTRVCTATTIAPRAMRIKVRRSADRLIAAGKRASGAREGSREGGSVSAKERRREGSAREVAAHACERARYYFRQ